jgi:hypothetical protein
MNNHEKFEDDFRHFAKNDKGERVHVCRDEGPIEREDYICIACGQKMRAVMGKNNEWHFRHVVANPECDNESYLHRMAKDMIKERFDNSDTFNVSHYMREVCANFKKCHKHTCSCESIYLKTINLKEDYDTCTPEKTEGDFPFRADLKLSSSKNPDKESIFIEIAYTHDCEPEKINSGIPIIELKVNVDTDINHPLVEYNVMLDYASANPYRFTNLPKVRFYNFPREVETKEIAIKCPRYPYVKAMNTLVKRIKKEESFIINYNVQKTCTQINKCPLSCDACKNQATNTKEDLKSLYDTFKIDGRDNFVISSSNSDISPTVIKFTVGGKGQYEEGGRIIEFLYPNDIKKDFSEDLMNVQLDNADNPYENIVRPSIRFYNFDRFVTGECTIVFKRFAIVKDADNLLCGLLDDVDCHHFNDWPENAIYCLAAPEKYYEDSRYFYYCCLIKSRIEGFNIHHCALCEHCHTSEGGCRRYGYYMFYLLHDEKINKFEESRLCKMYSVNKKGLQYIIKNIPVPLIEWKR